MSIYDVRPALSPTHQGNRPPTRPTEKAYFASASGLTPERRVSSWAETMPKVRPTVRDGLVVREAPALPRGFQIRCTWCGCSVAADHEPGSYDCLADRVERDRSMADE